jgi:hypothetical protein
MYVSAAFFWYTFVLVPYGLLSPCRHNGTCINSVATGVKETGIRVAGQMLRDGAQKIEFNLVVLRERRGQRSMHHSLEWKAGRLVCA